MGCDIHFKCEIKKGGKWEINTDKVFPNPYYEKNSEYEWQKDEFQDSPDDGRNYDWFAILADVRNGYGFAGVSTGSGFDVIAEPKGLPEDLSEEGLKFFCNPVAHTPELEDDEDEDGNYYVSPTSAKKWVDGYGCKFVEIAGKKYVTNPDYHSTSYLTLEDFDNFDWNQFTFKYGVIGLGQYEKLRGTTDSPNSWCGASSGSNIITVSTDIADAILADPEIRLKVKKGKGFLRDSIVTIDKNGKPASQFTIKVSYEWPVHYSEWFEHKIKNTVEPMRELKQKYEDVRIVFGFDN